MTAWGLIALGALLWCLVVCFWLRRQFWLRWWLALLIPVWSLSPAPVEGSPDDYAPAMIAVFYEWLIEPDGNPGTAIAVLVISTLLLTCLVTGAYFARLLTFGRGLSWRWLAARVKSVAFNRGKS